MALDLVQSWDSLNAACRFDFIESVFGEYLSEVWSILLSRDFKLFEQTSIIVIWSVSDHLPINEVTRNRVILWVIDRSIKCCSIIYKLDCCQFSFHCLHVVSTGVTSGASVITCMSYSGKSVVCWNLFWFYVFMARDRGCVHQCYEDWSQFSHTRTRFVCTSQATNSSSIEKAVQLTPFRNRSVDSKSIIKNVNTRMWGKCRLSNITARGSYHQALNF